MPQLTIIDEKLGRERSVALTLDCLTETMTVRELIRARVYQEVSEYNAEVEETWATNHPTFLVTPTEVEQQLNDASSKAANKRRKARKKVDWEKQVALANDAFTRNGFFILVGDRQAESLEESFSVAVDTEVTFVKLAQLVGG